MPEHVLMLDDGGMQYIITIFIQKDECSFLDFPKSLQCSKNVHLLGVGSKLSSIFENMMILQTTKHCWNKTLLLEVSSS